MKKIINSSIMIVIFSSLISCGYSACDCVEAMSSSRANGVFYYPPNMTSAEANQCVRDYQSSASLVTPIPNSVVENALKNAKKKCDDTKNETNKNFNDYNEDVQSNALLYDQSSGVFQFNNSLNKEISTLDNYTDKYCDCLDKVADLMNENRDYDEASGSYGIDGYAQLSESEKKIKRAKDIMLYNLSPSQCSTFGDPDFFDVLFSKEVLNLCGNPISN